MAGPGTPCSGGVVANGASLLEQPRLSIGLRLRLIDLTDGQLLWAVEQIWDSTDRQVQRRIRAYAHSQLRYATGPTPEELVTLSTLEFVKFVATEVAQTLERQEN